MKQAIDSIVDLKENLSQYLASRKLLSYILYQGAADNVIKTTSKKAQETTTDHTRKNLPQKYQWHTLVEYLIANMKNTWICSKTEKNWGIDCTFYCSFDIMCLMSDAFWSFAFDWNIIFFF